MNKPKLIKDEDRDLWYKKMGERKPIGPEDYPSLGLMEWVDLIRLYRK